MSGIHLSYIKYVGNLTLTLVNLHFQTETCASATVGNWNRLQGTRRSQSRIVRSIQ